MKYGYVRVSTQEQNEARQMVAMCREGIKTENIFIDKQSGKNYVHTSNTHNEIHEKKIQKPVSTRAFLA